ncbi:MAG: hypothetical protein H0U67_05385 [Gemmatimonadetes bacterium]|nr:hypothetical protein [Gemmatimonadota bacterium]
MKSLETRLRDSRPVPITSPGHRVELAGVILNRVQFAREESAQWSLAAYLMAASGSCSMLVAMLVLLNSGHSPPVSMDPVAREIIGVLQTPLPEGVTVSAMVEVRTHPTREQIAERLAVYAEQRQMLDLYFDPDCKSVKAPSPES